MFQQTIKNFNINLNSLNERGTFRSGDLLSGHISFELTKETKITSLTMSLRGKANVHWTTSGGGGRRGRRRRRQHNAKLDYFNLKSVILQENRAIQPGTTKLQPGTHVYPFTCQIPQGNFPASFRGVNGEITYSLTVGINRPWHMSKDFVTELNFVNHIDSNHPELWAPLAGSNTMTVCCLWCATGPITVTARTEKKAFIPGETVKIICDFSNASTRVATPKVKLHQNQVFYTHNRVSTLKVPKVLAAVTGQPISPQTSDVHTEILLAIPSSAAFTISNCSIIDVSYNIEVSLSVRASHDLTVLFPIILYDPPLNIRPPQRLELPSSFKGSHGKIVYSLEANLSRSMRADSKAKAKFTLIHNRNLKSDPSLTTPQHSMTEKKMKFFASGTVGMDVNIERTGFYQGEGIKVVASILNRSSRDIKPKYCLYKKYSYFAKVKRKVKTKAILKEVGDVIPPSASQTVTRVLTIPPDTCVSVLNCNILKAEYRLRVYLDVKYTLDPEIKFPIVILPALEGSGGEHLPAHPNYGFDAFASSDLPGGTSFLQPPTGLNPSAPPPSYGTYAMYLSLSDFNGKF